MMSNMNILRNTIFILFFPLVVAGQVGNYDDLVPPPDVRPRTFEDYLVQLAWENNPQRKVAGQEVAVAKSQVKATKKSWMEPIGANLGFNSVRDTISFSGNRYLAPGYNYGISLSLGSMFTNKSKVNLANEKVKVEELKMDELKLAIRTEVLQRYQKYLLSIEVLKARQKAEEDAHSKFTLISELFEKNKADFEEYNEASISYQEALEKRLTSQTDISLTKYELEEILGMKWDSLEKIRAQYEKK